MEMKAFMATNHGCGIASRCKGYLAPLNLRGKVTRDGFAWSLEFVADFVCEFVELTAQKIVGNQGIG